MSAATDSGATPERATRAPKKAPKPQGIRQSMSDLHIWTGLLVGWILYAMFLTGTVSYFKDEISQWTRPEIAVPPHASDAGELSNRMAAALTALAPGSTQWSFALPDARNPGVDAFWRSESGRRGFDRGTFDPATGHKLDARETRGGDFFYRFHFDLHYLPPRWSRWIVGFCAMFMLVAIVSGVITHKKIFIDFFTFRGGKGQRSWLDAHSALSVLGLPFHFMITYSGLITLMLMYMPWGDQMAFKTPQARQAMSSELSAFLPAEKPSGRAAPLVPVGDLVRQAQERWGLDGVGRVTVANAGDAVAKVTVARSDHSRISTSPQFMRFDGVTGALLQIKDSVGGAAQTRGVLYGLHLGRFADTMTRWLYFLVSLAGTAMVGTGLVLWTVKRRQKLPDPERPYLGFRLVERLNIAAIAGLSIAMTAFLWANRLLPTGMAERGQWEIHLFFIAWALSLFYTIVRPARKAWVELLWTAAVLLALLPLLNAFTTERGLWRNLREGDTVFVAMQLMFFVFAALHALLAVRTARHRPRVRAARATPAAPVRRAAQGGDEAAA